MVQTVQRTMETPQLLLDTVVNAPVVQVVQVVDIPFVTQRLFTMVLVTIEVPQLLVDKGLVAPVVQVVQVVDIAFVTQRPIPLTMVTHGGSPVARGQGVFEDHKRDPTVAAH